MKVDGEGRRMMSASNDPISWQMHKKLRGPFRYSMEVLHILEESKRFPVGMLDVSRSHYITSEELGVQHDWLVASKASTRIRHAGRLENLSDVGIFAFLRTGNSPPTLDSVWNQISPVN